jgi:hypothetical protein
MQLDPRTGTASVSGYPNGMDNRHGDTSIPDGALRDAFNVDVLDSGNIRMRQGPEQRIADPDAHSVTNTGSRLVWATRNTLKISGPNFTQTTLLTDIRLAAPLSYVLLHGILYFSNEQINGTVTAAGAYAPWGIVPPAVAPAAVAGVTGIREYQITCTFVTATGEESGAPAGVLVYCNDTPVIAVSGIPQSADSRVTHTRIYVTDINNDVFTSAIDVPAGLTSWTLSGPFGYGSELETQFMEPPPPGQLIRHHNGKIYIAAGANIWETEPLRFGICDVADGPTMETERVTVLMSVVDGIYISSDRVYFLGGIGTDAVVRRPVLPYRAVEGAACDLPDKTVAWMSALGIVRGSDGGQVANVTEGQIAVDGYVRGAMAYREHDGHKGIVALMSGAVAGTGVSADFLAGDVLRKAEVV